MPTEIRVPNLGESIVEATVGQWFKQAGDTVSAAEPLVELETDKVTVEVPAPASGVLAEIVVKTGETVPVGALLGAISEGDGKGQAHESQARSGRRSASPRRKRRQSPRSPRCARRRPPSRRRSSASRNGARR